MAQRIPIKLNGVTLPSPMIAAEAQHHPAKTPAAAFQAAARALIVRTLLLEEAQRRQLQAEPELVAEGKRETRDEALIRVLLEESLQVSAPPEAACRAYYQDHPERFRSPDLYEASHILFAAREDDADGLRQAEMKAQAAIAEIRQRPDLFETIARERSDCGSRSSGGRLGQSAAGDLVAEFEAAIAHLAPGEMAQMPVRTRYGFHVVRLDAKVEGRVLPFDYVRDQIADFLAQTCWHREAASFVARLVDAADIEGVDMKLDRVPQPLAS